MKGGYKVLIYPVHNVFRAGKLSYSYDLCLDDMKFNGDKEKKVIHTDIKRIRNGTDNKCDNRNVLKRYSIEGRNHRRFYQESLSVGLKVKLGSDNW